MTAPPPSLLASDDPAELIVEWQKCAMSAAYFIHNYCKIYDATAGMWIPFRLWPEQMSTLDEMIKNQLTCVLKARQLGLSWLVICLALWYMIFHSIATILLFSRRDDDATYLLGDERMRGVYRRLPEWLKLEAEVIDSSHHWKLSNGSNAKAFPTTGGDSYTASFVMVDEADLIPDLNRLLRSTKPTIDAGGKMILISRSDKTQPESEFKQIYVSAKNNLNGWKSVFLPWYVRPSRTKEWYDRQKQEILHRTGSLDDLHEQYPATDAEALAPRSQDKRINIEWLNQCYLEVAPLQRIGPALPGLRIWEIPQSDLTYVVGIDPAEGNPNSDPSSISVVCRENGEQVAQLSGKFEPTVTAAYADTLSQYYRMAPFMPERNNHGHTVIAWLNENSKARVLSGFDGKQGWLSSVRGKALLYDTLADSLRNGEPLIHSFDTYIQISSIEGSTLRAPEGQLDDESDSFALAWCGVAYAGIYAQFRQIKVKGRK